MIDSKRVNDSNIRVTRMYYYNDVEWMNLLAEGGGEIKRTARNQN